VPKRTASAALTETETTADPKKEGRKMTQNYRERAAKFWGDHLCDASLHDSDIEEEIKQIANLIAQVERETLEEAAKIAENFPAKDEADEHCVGCFADQVAAEIRAAIREGE
jgi:hypothetical protein